MNVPTHPSTQGTLPNASARQELRAPRPGVPSFPVRRDGSLSHSCPTSHPIRGRDGSELGVHNCLIWPLTLQIGKLRPSPRAAAQSLNHEPRSLGLLVTSGFGWGLRLPPAGPVREVLWLPCGPLTNTFRGGG